jgi:hypothetical protein
VGVDETRAAFERENTEGAVWTPTSEDYDEFLTFDVEMGQTTKWADDQLIVISAFWDAAVFAQQVGLA